ncbi:PP2C family protein-serine/threonine phosphatase [Larkinella humicola]|uniref:Serine/threonine-protein phosphatase n=1 Tax=Larkinella humicola TaxID=2607654 RepID=A0A5N1JB69_9BACT|nr:protein phosphatase 2C domain-containing protein [Larkinella humicola]KAA9349917.1 serine/threonine-protein phosphatase [Larkinella humicola]
MNPFLIAGQTNVGQRRKNNQDTFICSTIWSESSALLAAIDGVGGYAGGDRAAAIAKESIEQYMATPNGDPLSMLREAVVFANNQINAQREQNPQLAQMCCVLTTAVADSRTQKLYFVHVGDTRLYRYRRGILEKLTHDHSMVGVREDANELTEAEAMQHPRRNEILREVGSMAHRVDDPDFLESGETDFLPGDLLLLCSDGLTDMITQAQIQSVLDQNLSLEKQVTELIGLANKQGGNDNITVVLAQNTTPATPQPVVANSTDQTLPLKPSSKPAPAISPKTTSGKTEPAKRSLTGFWILIGLVLAGTIAGLVWYQNQAPSQSDPLVSDNPPMVSDPADSTQAIAPTVSRFDSLLQTAYRSTDHRLMLPADTVRLTQPLLLTDSLQSIVGATGLTVFVPADTAQAQVALRITRSGPVDLQNLIISGFKTGIETSPGTKLHLSKVSFRNVSQPVQAVIGQDTFRDAVIVVTLQNQTDSSKTPPR